MLYTEYTCMSTTELTNYALTRDNSSKLEVELAQRLQLAQDIIENEEKRVTDLPNEDFRHMRRRI